MAITFNLAPIPKWIIIDQNGETAGGAKMYTKSSLNKTQDKPVFQDPAGALPYTNPVIFDANGTRGPFYWVTDSANPADMYYIEVYSSDNRLLWTIDNFDPASGGGGGGGGTTNISLENYIENNIFMYHNDTIVLGQRFTNRICSSNHEKFPPVTDTPIVSTHGVIGPDILHVTDATGMAGFIEFVQFSPGDDPLTGDVTPAEYLVYQCTGAGSGGSYNDFQFPIQHDVNSIDNQQFTFTIWARIASVPVSINLFVLQYFGSGGGGSSDIYQPVGASINLTNVWTKYAITFTVPSVAGKTFGACGDSCTFIRLQMPLNSVSEVWMTKPSLYLGSKYPPSEFSTNDQISAVINSPRTGQMKMEYSLQFPSVVPDYLVAGYIPMTNGSIGNAVSGANQRANIDTFPLFKLMWDNISDVFCPVTPGGRGANSESDFAAGKKINLPLVTQRAIGSTGANPGITLRALGEAEGAEFIALSAANLPPHVHAPNGGNFVVEGGPAILTTGGTGFGYSTASVTGNPPNAISAPFPIVDPISFTNFYIKL